jgi:hypothetical protein
MLAASAPKTVTIADVSHQSTALNVNSTATTVRRSCPQIKITPRLRLLPGLVRGPACLESVRRDVKRNSTEDGKWMEANVKERANGAHLKNKGFKNHTDFSFPVQKLDKDTRTQAGGYQRLGQLAKLLGLRNLG